MNVRVKEIERERRERRKIRRKTKNVVLDSTSAGHGETLAASGDSAPVHPTSASASASGAEGDVQMADATATASATVGAGDELQDEVVYLEKEKKEIEGLVHESLRGDRGGSVSGLYDLYGVFFHPSPFRFSCITCDYHLSDSPPPCTNK